jgi:hypothetical protein
MSFRTEGHEGVAHLGPERGWLSFERVVEAAQVVDSSGALDIIAQQKAAVTAGRGPGGRPALVSDRAIRPDSLRYLGLETPGTDEQVYDRLVRAFTRIVKPIDPFPGPRRKHLTAAEAKAVKDARDPVASAANNEILHSLCNSLVTASARRMTPESAANFTGNVAIDATFIKANGRRGTDKRESKFAATEYDSGRYYRDGNHSGRDIPSNGKGKGIPSKTVNGWGLELTTVSMVRSDTTSADHPLLILGIALDEPAGAPGQNGIRALTAVYKSGMPIKHLLGDRAYYAGAAVENFHETMAEFGYLPVTDYKVTQLGLATQHKGAIQVEGWWYCPCMPQGLIDASIDYRAAEGGISDEDYYKKIAARVKYAAVRKSRPDKDGTSRWSHPTGLGHRCKPGRKDADQFCTQKTISIPREAGLQFAQEIQYKSPEWREMYARRNTVESGNAKLKRSTTHGLGDPERRRVRGRTSQFLLASLVVVAANIQTIRTFANNQKNRLKIETKKKNRRRVPFGFSTMNDDERQHIEAVRSERRE